jgi:hypothetical protein
MHTLAVSVGAMFVSLGLVLASHKSLLEITCLQRLITAYSPMVNSDTDLVRQNNDKQMFFYSLAGLVLTTAIASVSVYLLLSKAL